MAYKNNNNTSVTLSNIRISYEHLMRPYAREANKEPRYSCTILLPKTDVAGKARLDAAIEAAKQAGVSFLFGGVMPPNLRTPIRDGDGYTENGDKFGAECAGCWVITAATSADRPVEIVDRNMNRIIDAAQVYSGMYANINVRFYVYDRDERRGIGCALGPVQKVADGERLWSSTPTAADCFTSLGDAPAAVLVPGQAPIMGAVNPVTGAPMQG